MQNLMHFYFATILLPLCSCGSNSVHLKACILTTVHLYKLSGFCQLILGHIICEFKTDPNIVSDATFNGDFKFAKHLTATLYLWFEWRLSQVASGKS
jgi:hypothetical protein